MLGYFESVFFLLLSFVCGLNILCVDTLSQNPGDLNIHTIPKSDKQAIGGRSIAKTPWRINQNEKRILIDGLITPGYDPTGHAKECQDNLLIDQGFNNTDMQIVILADGHGKQGAVAAML